MYVKIVDTIVSDERGTLYYEYQIQNDEYSPDVLDDMVSRLVKMASVDRAIRTTSDGEEPDVEDLE